jgi:hypothetical protein
MTALTRRHVIASAVATAAAVALPGAVLAAPTTEVDDPEFALLRAEIDRLFGNLRVSGYGSLRVETTTKFCGGIAFWLDKPDDMLSMRWAPFDDAGPAMESA